jgi:hypothetical protein
MRDLHYVEISFKCGGLRTDPAWLDSIEPALGCRCGSIEAARKINVRMTEELNYSVLYAAFFERTQKIRTNGKIEVVGRNVDKGGLIPVVDHQLLEAVGLSHFEESFYIGKVEFLASSGRRRFASLVPKSNASQVVVRGSENSGFSFCSICKKFPIYTMGLPFKPYVLKRDTFGLSAVLATPNGSFLIRSDLIEPLRRFRKTFHANRVEVVDEPADELPAKLSELPEEFSRRLKRPTVS